MARQDTIPNVPNADVPRVKKDFEDEGATVVVTPNPDGTTSKIVATFP
jgi:hypothetical protein